MGIFLNISMDPKIMVADLMYKEYSILLTKILNMYLMYLTVAPLMRRFLPLCISTIRPVGKEPDGLLRSIRINASPVWMLQFLTSINNCICFNKSTWKRFIPSITIKRFISRDFVIINFGTHSKLMYRNENLRKIMNWIMNLYKKLNMIFKISIECYNEYNESNDYKIIF